MLQNKTEEKAPPLLVDIKEAARLLGVSERTVWQLTNDGKLKSIAIGKRGIRYSFKSLQEFAGEKVTA